MDIYLFFVFLIFLLFAYLDYKTKHEEWPKSKKIKILLRTFLIWASPLWTFYLLGHPKERILEKIHIWYFFVILAVFCLFLAFVV